MQQRSMIVLGISGSLRAQSSNTRLLASIGSMMPAGTEFRMHHGLANLPHFSPDLDGDEAQVDGAVREWREELRASDACVICTPEYARGVPGSLKNALDWSVSSGEFMNMPTAVLSASPHADGGSTALHSLTLTLQMMSAAIPEKATMAVPFISKIIAADGSVTDTDISSSLRDMVTALTQAVPE
ncbi:NADPH-dependent FMN reductase [Paenibacillus methanolicus]|uniref:NAD(P)H-dependent FMN reductase n=1 Tax=Paenibacillus methanolicus TaxID=582686 RepID=A0A5S5BSZ7_9BACL|nr:NADPH-dependent FMN reductase [Paenibacillus methanolicus]TYP70179.1 NAD(P)H-dependent FMN reductase [Paenibacillus methanolicus]